jgi:hypothetical protein
MANNAYGDVVLDVESTAFESLIRSSSGGIGCAVMTLFTEAKRERSHSLTTWCVSLGLHEQRLQELGETPALLASERSKRVVVRFLLTSFVWPPQGNS